MKKSDTGAVFSMSSMPAVFKALSEPTRLKILLMLEGKARTVGEIVNFFDLSQPTITRHLQALTAGNLVIRRKDGQKVFYEVNPESVGSLCMQLSACFPCACVTVTLSKGADCCADSADIVKKKRRKK
jgi:ArsR family transcriptional regulator, repressor of sdpIR and other operons